MRFGGGGLVMADEGNESRLRWMDLNLYLGLPRSPRRLVLDDLGSDLALGSLPAAAAAGSGDMPAADADMSVVAESSDPNPRDAPYSPTHASYNLDEDRIYSPTDPSYHPEMRAADDHPGVTYEPVVLGFEPPGGLYSPSQALPTVEENDELQMSPYVPMSPLPPMSPPMMIDRASPPRSRPPHRPYMLPNVPFPSNQRSFEDTYFDFGHLTTREPEVGSSSREDRLSSPEFRFARLIEVNERLQRRRFWMSPTRADSGRPSSPATEPLEYGKSESPAKHVVTEVVDEETKDKLKAAANFECNICLDMAVEPVVTTCGHLFCWPCIYQWLNLHSDHRECPVCKGEVVESNIIPIYGRGNSELSDDKKLEKKEEAPLEIPPRPRGNRYESFRQQFRPISRRLGEGIANSWRRLVDQRLRNRSNVDPSLAGMYDIAYQRAPLTRMRARRIQREERISETPSIARDSGLLRDGSSIPHASSSNLHFRDGDPWRTYTLHNLSTSERLAAMAVDLTGVVGRFGSSSSNLFAASTSAANLQPPELPVVSAPNPASSAAEQASASSTMAVIQGDAAATDASVEPNSAGSSRIYRRRGRSSGSGSLDVDGVQHGDAAATGGPVESSSAGSSRIYRRRGRSSASSSLDVDGGSMHGRKRRRLN